MNVSRFAATAVQTSRTLVRRATDRREKWRITAIAVSRVQWELTDWTPIEKVTVTVVPLRSPGPLLYLGPLGCTGEGLRALAREEERPKERIKAETGQTSLPFSKLGSPSQRDHGCPMSSVSRGARTWGTYTGQDAGECSARNAPLSSRSTTPILLHCRPEIKSPLALGRVRRKCERIERYPPRRGGRGT